MTWKDYERRSRNLEKLRIASEEELSSLWEAFSDMEKQELYELATCFIRTRTLMLDVVREYIKLIGGEHGQEHTD